MANPKAGHVNWGPWSLDYHVSDGEGLSLLNVSFNGITVLGKASVPAIRVKYTIDYNKGGCGPFVDHIQWSYSEVKKRLVHISGRCHNEIVCIDESSGQPRWLEMAVYARLGAYHIFQAWYLSEQGTIQPVVFSKGLECPHDHVHHVYWRLDFDIAGPAHNRVNYQTPAGWFYYPKEANDVKTNAPNKRWFVRNLGTGFFRGAWIIPQPHDGQADGFSKLDVAVRRYHQPEELHPWPFDIGELGFMHNETVGDDDVVFWYVSHLFHQKKEGSDQWHSAGPLIQLQGFFQPPPD